VDNSKRLGAPLRGKLEGVWSARRGTYRVLYPIDDDRLEVVVLRVGHRRAVYRPTWGSRRSPTRPSRLPRFRTSLADIWEPTSFEGLAVQSWARIAE